MSDFVPKNISTRKDNFECPLHVSLHLRHQHTKVFIYEASCISCILKDLTNGVRSPGETKDFSFTICVQTSSEAHSASCTMGTGDPLPGGKARPGRDAEHSPHLVPR
jgi:hypothetical protein